MRRLVISLALLSFTSPLFAQVAEGDRLFAARAEGHKGARAAAGPIDAAIVAYQRGVAQNPNDLEARWKLLRAIRYKGAYVAATNEEKKKVYGVAKNAGEQAMAVIDRLLAARGMKSVSRATEKQMADVVRTIPHAAEIVYWDAVSWGEWALAYGKMAAVREGAADRIKRQSTIVMLADPKLERGGGARVLGRLHNQTPRVPFVTGWASDEEAVKYLNLALAQDPTDKLTRVFLAEAMVGARSATKPQAVQMLREVVRGTPDPVWIVEDLAAQNEARALLKAWKVE